MESVVAVPKSSNHWYGWLAICVSVIFGVLVVMCCRPEKFCQERKIDLRRDLGRSRGAVEPPSVAAKGARSDDRHQEARRQGRVGKRSPHHCWITLIHQHAKGQGQESLLEGIHPVLTHLLPLCGGYVLLGEGKHGLLFERSVFCQDPYQVIERRFESFWIAAEAAPVPEPMDRFVVRSRDGLMLFPHDGHDLCRLGLGPFQKQRPENQVFAFVMRMQNLAHKLYVGTDAGPTLRID